MKQIYKKISLLKRGIWEISQKISKSEKRYRLWEAIFGRYSKETETIWEWHSSGIEKV